MNDEQTTDLQPFVAKELILGPAPHVRIVHRAASINSRGDVSALCFGRPRAIDMKRASWVLRDEAVTCPKCLKAIQNG